MTNISKLSFGEFQRFVQTLHGAGFTEEDAKRIIKDPSLASAMYTSIQPKPHGYSSVDIVARVERQLTWYADAGFVIHYDQRLRIRAQAKAFVPLSVTDRPLVTGVFGYAPEAFNRIWPHVELDGYDKVRYFNRDEPIQFVSGMKLKSTLTKPRLVHFDPNTYRDLSPESALKQAKVDKIRLAGVEVVEMLLVEPGWASDWNGTGHPYPNCSALQFGQDWVRVPYLDRWDTDPRLVLDSRRADDWDNGWSSPSVREC